MAHPERRARRRTLAKAVRLAAQPAALAAIAYVIFHERHLFAGFTHELHSVRWYWIVLALAAELASIPPLAEVQRLVFLAGGAKTDRLRMILVTFASNAIAQSAPLGIAVAEGYAYKKYRWLGADATVAAWGELGAGAIAFSGLAGVALVGSIIAGGTPRDYLLPILAVVFAGSTGAAVVFRHPQWLVNATVWIDRRVGRRLGRLIGGATRRVREASMPLCDIHPSLAIWVTAGLLGAANWVLDAVTLALSFLAVGRHVPWGVVLLAFAGSKIVNSLGITPAGLGLVEGSLVGIFISYDVSGAAAGAATLVYRGLTLIGLVGLGWVAAGVLAVMMRRENA